MVGVVEGIIVGCMVVFGVVFIVWIVVQRVSVETWKQRKQRLKQACFLKEGYFWGTLVSILGKQEAEKETTGNR